MTDDQHMAYERLGTDFAVGALRSLMYLNGGALIAIPTAIAIFRADHAQSKCWIIGVGLFFIFGCVVATLWLSS